MIIYHLINQLIRLITITFYIVVGAIVGSFFGGGLAAFIGAIVGIIWLVILENTKHRREQTELLKTIANNERNK